MAKRPGPSVEKSGGKSGIEMVAQQHGGRLRVGSLPGNTPGTGRPPSAIRAAMRLSLDQRLKVAEAIADDEKANPSERLKALELLARYGLGTNDTLRVPVGAEADGERLRRLRELMAKIEAN